MRRPARLLRAWPALVLACAALHGGPVRADPWRVAPPGDAGASASRAAQSGLVDGARVAVFRGPDGVWLYLRAPAGLVLGPGAPELRVDGAPTRDLETLRRAYAGIGLDYVHAAPREFALRIWSGAGEPVEPLRSLLAGRELEVRFPVARGAAVAVRFTLAGAADAIRAALALDGWQPGIAAQADAHDATLIALTRGCLATRRGSELDRCLDRVAACGRASIDASDLLGCAVDDGSVALPP